MRFAPLCFCRLSLLSDFEMDGQGEAIREYQKQGVPDWAPVGIGRRRRHMKTQRTELENCDRCGRPLEKGQWIIGLCRRCEAQPAEVVGD